MIYMTFVGVVLGLLPFFFLSQKAQKHALKKSYRSSGASGGFLHGGASFKVEKAHFAARKKGPENGKKSEPEKLPVPVLKGRNATKIQHQYW